MNGNSKPIYSMFMLILSIYILVVVFLGSFFIKDTETKLVLQYIDFSICILFLGDFFVNLYRADSKLAYIKWGWLDFISSIPVIDPLRWARISKVIRILRFLRTIKSIKVLILSIQRSKFQSFTLVVLLITFLAYTICASMILEYERDAGGSIQTAEDALWWAFLNIMNAKISISQAQSSVGIVFTVILNKVGLLLFAYFNAITIAWLINRRVNFGNVADQKISLNK
ncbi:ion transporter [Agarilytica rhodophyticola]|uniref:ion transporter n=1 Tax=Agarilytica rhodophyticola TaxID=1737490 RepID=UPI000B347E4B|nr:ion transporter [Agarilytica rhodophyticola]